MVRSRTQEFGNRQKLWQSTETFFVADLAALAYDIVADGEDDDDVTSFPCLTTGA